MGFVVTVHYNIYLNTWMNTMTYSLCKELYLECAEKHHTSCVTEDLLMELPTHVCSFRQQLLTVIKLELIRNNKTNNVCYNFFLSFFMILNQFYTS